MNKRKFKIKKIEKYFKKLIPNSFKFIIKNILSIFNISLKNKEELIPPMNLIFIGSGNFLKIGKEFFNYFIELCQLKPYESVLDVGCGIGRMAIPLTKYLNKEGNYYGFDIVAEGINWCKKNITSKYPNFNFYLADIYNKYYNPNGKYKASNYRFPFDNESFDFVFLTSVFTHMLLEEIENYLSEISRVLKKHGRCLITYFLLNKKSELLINNKKSDKNFKYNFGIYKTINKNIPESAVAYSEEFIRSLYLKYRLFILEPIYYGSWCGRKVFLSYQDIIIAKKIN